MTTAKKRYETLLPNRLASLQKARDCALLTIPSLLPPSGHSASNTLPTPWQTLGARCVNSLASKLMLTLFPPTLPFFKFQLDGKAKVQAEQSGEATEGKINTALNTRERAILAEFESSGVRPQLFQALRLLVATGDVLINFPSKEGPIRIFRKDRYVVARDPMGNLLEAVVCENVAPSTLSETARAMLPANNDKVEKDVELFTHLRWTGSEWKIYQELVGKQIPGTQGTYPKNKCPWLHLRMTAIDNEDYGRGLVEEYLGDFRSLETLAKAMVLGTAAGAKVVFLVNPLGNTDPKVISKSDTGDVKEGRAEDVSTMKVDKAMDFSVAQKAVERLESALSYAFLLNSAIQRNGERVTAEEIRYMAEELESSLGGVYSNLSQELQLAIVTLLQVRLEKRGVIAPLPPNTVRPTITTGIDALGRGQERNRLVNHLKTLYEIDPEVSAKLDMEEVSSRLAAADGIDTKKLFKSAEVVQQEQQAQLMRQMIDKLGPNAVTQLGQMAQNSQQAGTAASPQ